MIRWAWPLRASFLILTSVYEDQEARNRRKWMPPASGPLHSRSPRRMGSLAARSLARESASRSLAQEGRVAATRRKGTGTRKASRIDAESVCLVQLFLWAIDRILLLLAHLGLGPLASRAQFGRSSCTPRAGPACTPQGWACERANADCWPPSCTARCSRAKSHPFHAITSIGLLYLSKD